MNKEILKRAISKAFLGGEIDLTSFQKSMKELFQKSIGGSPDVNGLAELHGVSVSNIVDQLSLGVRVEEKKTGCKNKAKRIALTNLLEFPDYYTKLEAFPARQDIEIKKSGKGALYIFSDNVEKALNQFKEGVEEEPTPLIEIKKSTINEFSDSVEGFFQSSGFKVFNKSYGEGGSITLRMGDPIDGVNVKLLKKGSGSNDPLCLDMGMGDDEIGKRLIESIGTIILKYPELEKARHGVYQDNPENRRLKRVGQKYGTKRQEDPTKQKQQGKKEESKMQTKEFTDEDLGDFARQTSEEDLNAAATGADERLRLAAKIELERRKEAETIVVTDEEGNRIDEGAEEEEDEEGGEENKESSNSKIDNKRKQGNYENKEPNRKE